MDLTKLSDEELDQHRRDVLVERGRRQSLETIPQQIAELKAKYVEGGGDLNDLEQETTV